MPAVDILVIGSGIAGLSFALKVARRFPHQSITIITKNHYSESNTRYAQGGIAVALDQQNDSFESHIEDTIRAGDGLNKKEVVELVVKEGPARLQELLEWKIEFDHDTSGMLSLGREGGHTAHRIIHAKDATGHHITTSLLERLSEFKNVILLSHYFVVDLIIDDSSCKGVYAIGPVSTRREEFFSNVTVLATGGVGQVYRTTTNPLVATGDGIAMAYRAGASVRDMEFVQFHPTAFYSEIDNPSFLISEALRGFGAYLRNKDGERFVFKYDKRGELASRDIISKAIVDELKIHNEQNVFLDCRHLPANGLISKFPTIYSKCLERGIDFTKHMIPVTPAAHYLCGGIETDLHARTSIKNLFACGECACTGLHGANRLASNSLLEALVFSHRCFLAVEQILQNVHPIKISDSPELKATNIAKPSDMSWIVQTRNELQQVMNQDVGIIRSFKTLKRALKKLNIMKDQTEQTYKTNPLSAQLCELRNMITVGLLIVNQSLKRNENKGTYYNIDLQKSLTFRENSISPTHINV